MTDRRTHRRKQTRRAAPRRRRRKCRPGAGRGLSCTQPAVCLCICMHALTPAVRPERGSLGCPSTASPVVLFRPGQASPRHASTARADNETTTGGRNERRAGAAEQRRRRDPGPGSCSVPTAYDRAGSPELQRHARCEDSTGRHLNPCPVVSVSSRLKTFLCPYLLDDGLLSSTIMCSVYLSSVSFFFLFLPRRLGKRKVPAKDTSRREMNGRKL